MVSPHADFFQAWFFKIMAAIFLADNWYHCFECANLASILSSDLHLFCVLAVIVSIPCQICTVYMSSNGCWVIESCTYHTRPATNKLLPKILKPWISYPVLSLYLPLFVLLLFINQSFHESLVYATGDPQGRNKIVSIQKKRTLDSVNTINPTLTMFAFQFRPISWYNLLSLLYSFSQDTDIAN